MSTDLVLLKSRSQRFAEMIILPAGLLPLGPVLRALLGAKYDVFYGLAAIALLFMLFTRLSSQWASHHGGEWVTKAERVRRLVTEVSQIPSWLNAAATSAMVALMLLGLLLVIEPFDSPNYGYGGPLSTALVVAAVSLLSGARVLFNCYSKRQPAISDEAPPSGYFWSELRSALPLTYAAYAFAAVVAFLVAMQLKGSTQFVAFFVIFLMTSQLPLILLRRAGKRIYPASLDANLGRQILAGTLLWGIPMGMMFGAALALDSIGHPAEMALKIAVMLPLGAIAGAAVGVLLYVNLRLSEARRAQ
jgi:hypothetical protein